MSDTTVKPVLWIRSSSKDFRAVYTVKFATAIYVLHAFQKKSKSGIKTSTEDLKLIQRRLKAVEADYKVQLGKANAS